MKRRRRSLVYITRPCHKKGKIKKIQELAMPEHANNPSIGLAEVGGDPPAR